MGSLLIDRKHKITITISARSTLNRIKGVKGRKKPYYLQTICHELNGDLKAEYKQMTFVDMEGVDFDPVFADEIYKEDFDCIMEAVISQSQGYHHCVISYEAEQLEIKDLSLLIFDADLDVVREISLMDLLQPDFGTLTAEVASEEEVSQTKDAHSLVKVKAGLKSKNANEPEKKPIISTKREEVWKQA